MNLTDDRECDRLSDQLMAIGLPPLECAEGQSCGSLDAVRALLATRTPEVTRFEVIDHRVLNSAPGRAFVANPAKIELSYQDGGRTLKVFVTDGPRTTP